MKKLSGAFLIFLTIVFLPASSLHADEINLSAALGLKEVLNELAEAYSKKNPGVTFKKNYAASGALAKQIENGASADIFISANMKWMEYLKTKMLVDGRSIYVLASNELVFAGKPGLTMKSIEEIVKLDKIAIGSPKSVPAGEYAIEAFKKSGIEKNLQKKLVMARDVRECLLYAERGEVDGAFIFKTVYIQEKTKNAKILFTVPQKYYSKIVFPMALTESGLKKSDAVSFFSFLKSGEAKAVLEKYGWIVK